jgi:hypothetical protein
MTIRGSADDIERHADGTQNRPDDLKSLPDAVGTCIFAGTACLALMLLCSRGPACRALSSARRGPASPDRKLAPLHKLGRDVRPIVLQSHGL